MFKIKMVEFTGSGEDRLSFSTLTSSLPTPDPTSVLSSLQRRLSARPDLEQDSTRCPPKSVWWTPERAGLRPLLTRTFLASSQSLLCLCLSWVVGSSLWTFPGASRPQPGTMSPCSRSPDSGCLRSSDPFLGAGGLHPVPTQWMLGALTHRKGSNRVPRTDDSLTTWRQNSRCFKSTPATAAAWLWADVRPPKAWLIIKILTVRFAQLQVLPTVNSILMVPLCCDWGVVCSLPSYTSVCSGGSHPLPLISSGKTGRCFETQAVGTCLQKWTLSFHWVCQKHTGS